MLKAFVSGALKLRFALWAIEMALPSESDLKQRFRSGLMGVLVAVAGGVLTAMILIALIVTGGIALYHFGEVTLVQAILLTFGLSLVLVVALFAIGKAKLEEAFGAFRHRTPISYGPSDDAIRELVNGFVEGLVQDKKPAPRPTPDSTSKSATADDKHSYPKAA